MSHRPSFRPTILDSVSGTLLCGALLTVALAALASLVAGR